MVTIQQTRIIVESKFAENAVVSQATAFSTSVYRDMSGTRGWESVWLYTQLVGLMLVQRPRSARAFRELA